MTTLKTILAYLEENPRFAELDSWLDRYLQTIRGQDFEQLTHHAFNQIISSFYHDMKQNGLQPSRDLSSSEAFTEAAWMLEKHYQGHKTNGYDGALFDAVNHGTEGMVLVLERMAELVRSLELSRYVSWVIARCVDPSDWHLKKQLVEGILEVYKPWLSANLDKHTATEWIPCLEQLTYMIAQPLLRQSFLPTET